MSHPRREKEKLIDAYTFVLFSQKVDVLTHNILESHGLHLQSKYLIRKWRMAHFVGRHQWVFSNFQQKQHSQYTGEVTLNRQALAPM
jgi:hypothetical protein